jgi:hypothetical protein
MKDPSRAERVAFWKDAYARSSFIQADQFALLLLQMDPPLRSVMRWALTSAIVTAYSRPFKQRKEVRLPENDVVPAEFRKLHDEAIEQRDKVIAHRDLDGPVAAWGFVSQVVVRADAGGINIETLSPIMENDRALAMRLLCTHLVKLMDEHLKPFLRHLTPPPSPGNYVVGLEEDPTEWLRKVETYSDSFGG